MKEQQESEGEDGENTGLPHYWMTGGTAATTATDEEEEEAEESEEEQKEEEVMLQLSCLYY